VKKITSLTMLILLIIVFCAPVSAQNTIVFQDDFSGELFPSWNVTYKDANNKGVAAIQQDANEIPFFNIKSESNQSRVNVRRDFTATSGIVKIEMHFKTTGTATRAIMFDDTSAGTNHSFFGIFENNKFYHKDTAGKENIISNNIVQDQLYYLKIYLNISTYKLDILLDNEYVVKDAGFMMHMNSISSMLMQSYPGSALKIYDIKMEQMTARECSTGDLVVKKVGADNVAQSLEVGDYECSFGFSNETQNDVPAVLLMCIYDGDELSAVKSKSIVLGAGKSGIITSDISIAADVAGKQLEVFVWKDMKNNWALKEDVIILKPE